jgi:predicted phosphodiesterase
MKIGIVSDIHEDVVMLEKALKVFEEEKCDSLACLGDITGFADIYYTHGKTRDAHECIKIIKNHFDFVVKGNHDLFITKQLPYFSAGIHYPDKWFFLSAQEKSKTTNDRVWLYESDHHNNLRDEDLEFLIAAPEYKIIHAENHKIMFSHYLYPDLTGSLKKFHVDIFDFLPHFRFMEENDVLFGFCGHFHANGAHIANMKRLKRKRFGKTRLKEHKQCIIGPVIASGKNPRGVMIMDTINFELNLLKIKNQ